MPEKKQKTEPNNTENAPSSEKQADKESQVIQSQTISASFQGPIPHPNLLSMYNDVEPGLAGRIVTMAEKESIHRRKLEEKTLNAEIEANNRLLAERRLGQIFGFLIGLFTVGCGAWTAIQGAQIPGGLIGTGGVVGLVAVFIYGHHQDKTGKRIPKEESSPATDSRE